MASEIVVGIDFGTTHSGVSWAVNGGLKQVRLINDWPNPDSSISNSDKVPTVISYNSNGQPKNWGYNVETSETSFKWFKILLDPKNKVGISAPVVASSKLLRSLNKTAEDVAADYLKLIWKYTLDDIQRVKGDNWRSIYSLKVVLTVPAIWTPSAKEKTLNAARRAGIPDDISLVTEPEAAALAVLKNMNDEDEALKVGDSFVVCDAGGGTVDLISYKVTGLNPLQLEECAVGDGGLCGSVFVDEAFEKYIRTIVGESPYASIKENRKKKMIKEFENSVKRCYEGEDKKYSVDLLGVEDNPSVGIDDDTITLNSEVVKTIFDHVINKIVTLVEKQINESKNRGQSVKAVLLVGGFGANKYMYNRLKSAVQRQAIQVLQVIGAWSAICRGAALWGLENSSNGLPVRKTVAARIARYSYGICAAVPFDYSRHLQEDRVRLQDGNWWADSQMHWLLRKGERVEQGRTLTIQVSSSVQVGFWDTGIRAFTKELFYCAEDNPTSRKDPTVKELCNVDYGIECSRLWLEDSYRDPVTGEKWRDANFDLHVHLDSATLHFVVAYKDKPVAYTEAKYKEEF